MPDVGAESDFQEGRPALVTVRGREVAVVRWRGAFYAVAARCPHMNALLSGGVVCPKLTGGADVGMIELDERVPTLACPWHGWLFDLHTGAPAWDGTYGIRTYRASCEDGRVHVSLDRVRAEPP